MQLHFSELTKPCECGMTHTFNIKPIYLEEFALDLIPQVLQDLNFTRHDSVLIICDENTYLVAARHVHNLIPYANIKILSNLSLISDQKGLEELQDYISLLITKPKVILAVGSGTIHDLVKFICADMNIPFISVPTAASVAGYTTHFSSLVINGIKKSRMHCAPLAVVADTNVLARAPYRVTASGVGDLLGKYTALADWKIASLFGDGSFCERTYQFQLDAINDFVPHISELLSGSHEAYEKLMYAFFACGVATELMNHTRNVSGSEHQMAFLWEMNFKNIPRKFYHGEYVGVALLSMALYYYKILDKIQEHSLKISDPNEVEETIVCRSFPPEIARKILLHYSPSILSSVEPEELEEKLPEIARIIESIPNPNQIYMMLRQAHCASLMEEIALSSTDMEDSYAVAPYLNNRITLLGLSKFFKK